MNNRWKKDNLFCLVVVLLASDKSISLSLEVISSNTSVRRNLSRRILFDFVLCSFLAGVWYSCARKFHRRTSFNRFRSLVIFKNQWTSTSWSIDWNSRAILFLFIIIQLWFIDISDCRTIRNDYKKRSHCSKKDFVWKTTHKHISFAHRKKKRSFVFHRLFTINVKLSRIFFVQKKWKPKNFNSIVNVSVIVLLKFTIVLVPCSIKPLHPISIVLRICIYSTSWSWCFALIQGKINN